MPLEGYGLADLRPALRRAVESAAELDVPCDLDVDLDVPLAAAEALSAATGRRCETCGTRRVRAVVFTARSSQCGGIVVMVSDERSGFDPARGGTGEHWPPDQHPDATARPWRNTEVISAPDQPSARPAAEYGALISDLDQELLVWLQLGTGAYRSLP